MVSLSLFQNVPYVFIPSKAGRQFCAYMYMYVHYNPTCTCMYIALAIYNYTCR